MEILTDEPDLIRSFDSEIVDVLDGERSIIARINTGTVDRLRTLIDPMGADVSHFNKTRSVFWEHGQSIERGTLPIGSGWAKVRRSEKDMIGKTFFAKDEFSQALFELCKDGHLRSWSIHARKAKSSPPTTEERRLRPELNECDKIYRSWELSEYSLVSIPGNSDALTLMVSRGLIAAPEGFVMPEPVVETPKVIHTERYIECDGTAWRVFEPNGTQTAVFDDPELAEECLRMMGSAPTLSSQIASLFGEMRAVDESRHLEITQYVNLARWGKV